MCEHLQVGLLFWWFARTLRQELYILTLTISFTCAHSCKTIWDFARVTESLMTACKIASASHVICTAESLSLLPLAQSAGLRLPARWPFVCTVQS